MGAGCGGRVGVGDVGEGSVGGEGWKGALSVTSASLGPGNAERQLAGYVSG